MAYPSQQIISNIAISAGQELPTDRFRKAILCTKDAGRVVLGGACGGVKANNKDKVRNRIAR